MTELTVILGAASSGTLGLVIVNVLRDELSRGEQANSIEDRRKYGNRHD
jgi:hypothetical protein